ncbi:MAG TPA: glycine cleavage system protein GcvH [bacterium]|jgi:glycine cleavage system H protein|nr:glycine cleavage system protein GcvH [Myxococcales bacterium]OQA58979.1 MAG: Glycine cleavage system H protein [bacterium ADurb.Bin270]HPW45233.1 glycine cleavage system protein GcvH [bacterium]HQC51017.1 glycine cleavage system protein GcvH [bacterium]HQG13629.1 glycine cleavage system protein GcvH [bacterium]
MNIPDDLKYTKEHEWVKLEGKTATIGITDYAQEQLGDVVYVELPEEGEELAKDDTFGSIESVKAVSDCYSPLSGTINDVNSLLADSPEVLNEDCYGEGWLIKIKVADPSDLDDMMDHEEYKAFVAEESA